MVSIKRKSDFFSCCLIPTTDKPSFQFGKHQRKTVFNRFTACSANSSIHPTPHINQLEAGNKPKIIPPSQSIPLKGSLIMMCISLHIQDYIFSQVKQLPSCRRKKKTLGELKCKGLYTNHIFLGRVCKQNQNKSPIF